MRNPVVLRDRARVLQPAGAPERADGDVVEEVVVGHAGLVERRGDRVVREPGRVLRLGRQLVVAVAVGLPRPHVLAVGQRRAHERAVEAVERRERLRRVLDEAEVALGVVGDREHVVVAGAQEAVAPAAVELGATAVPRVVGVGMPAALEVGRHALRLVPDPVLVGVLQARLTAVRVGHPAEVVVEGPVLHHQHDDRVDGEVARRRQERAPLTAGGFGDERVGVQDGRERRRHPRGHRGPLQELAAAKAVVFVHVRHGSQTMHRNVAVR